MCALVALVALVVVAVGCLVVALVALVVVAVVAVGCGSGLWVGVVCRVAAAWRTRGVLVAAAWLSIRVIVVPNMHRGSKARAGVGAHCRLPYSMGRPTILVLYSIPFGLRPGTVQYVLTVQYWQRM